MPVGSHSGVSGCTDPAGCKWVPRLDCWVGRLRGCIWALVGNWGIKMSVLGQVLAGTGSAFVSYCWCKNDHKFSGLKQYKLVILWLWRWEIPRGSYWAKNQGRLGGLHRFLVAPVEDPILAFSSFQRLPLFLGLWPQPRKCIAYSPSVLTTASLTPTLLSPSFTLKWTLLITWGDLPNPGWSPHSRSLTYTRLQNTLQPHKVICSQVPGHFEDALFCLPRGLESYLLSYPSCLPHNRYTNLWWMNKWKNWFQETPRITECLSQECKEMLPFLTWKFGAGGGDSFLNLNSCGLDNAKINGGAWG